MHSWHFSGAWKNPKRKLNSWIAALSGVCRSSGWGWGWGWGWGCRLGWRQKKRREGVANGWQDGELSPMVELGRMQGIQWCHYLNSPLKNQSSKISIFYDVRFLFAMGWAYEFSASFYRSCLAWRSASLAGIIVHSVHPGNSSNSFPLLLQPAPVLVQWFWAATSSMLSSCLCGRGEQSREGGRKNIRKPKQNSRKTKLHFLQLEKFFASRLESCNNSHNNSNNIMGSNITGKGCVRFCVVVRFGSSYSSSSSSCCCCCRSVCCLLVRISKSFIIILWHWECPTSLPLSPDFLPTRW